MPRFLALARPFFRNLCLALALALPTPALAQQDVPTEAAAIEDVINRQIAAFEAGDFDTAFGFASPALQRFFGTPERFGTMVRQGYPMVLGPETLRFLQQRAQGDFLLQRVMILDREGRLHLLEYQMLPDDTGFVINAVRLLSAAAPGA
ncbi:MAG: DUF4864 domain-containing protein [Pararhodobacter sp.]